MSEQWEWFLAEAKRIVSEAEKRGLIFRIMGAVAIMLHCSRHGALLQGLERIPTDIDFVGYLKQRDEVDEMFRELQFESRFRDFAYGDRRILAHPSGKITVDIFFDELRMCHKVNFRDRLELDSPTITLADLFLEKMQIVKINEKDVKDSIVLLREHEIGETENETINAKYIARTLAKDWGYYYTVTTNLKRMRDEHVERFNLLNQEDIQDVKSKISQLVEVIDDEPKSTGWRLRARVGTRRPWYEEVEEVCRSSQ
jgi:hypothetical protein